MHEILSNHSVGSVNHEPGTRHSKEAELLKKLPAAIYCCNEDGFVTFYNDAAVELWGRIPVLGKDLWCGSWRIKRNDGSLMPLDSCPMAVCLKEGREVFGEEIVVVRPDGSFRNVLPYPQPIFDHAGKLTGAVNMLVDITALKSVENALRESEERLKYFTISLEREVALRTSDLQEANQKLLLYNSQLEQFAYAASHDMKEPLRKIIFYNSSVLDSCGDGLGEKEKGFLIRSVNAAKRMGDLIDNLLDYSKATLGMHAFEPIDLNELVEEILFLHKEILDEKQAVVEMDRLPVIRGIPFQFRQLLDNLIGNAMKYQHPERRLRLQIRMQDMGADRLPGLDASPAFQFHKLSFIDNGIGFEPRYADKIFELFLRLNDGMVSSGTGIGLAICKKIVENHGGRLKALGEPGVGARFDIYLPV